MTKKNMTVIDDQLIFLGLHSSQIVHEMGSPLTIINYCVDELKLAGLAPELICRLEQATGRLASCRKSILEFSGDEQEGLQNQPDLFESVQESLKILQLDECLRYELQVYNRVSEGHQVYISGKNLRALIGGLLRSVAIAIRTQERKEIVIEARSLGQEVELILMTAVPQEQKLPGSDWKACYHNLQRFERMAELAQGRLTSEQLSTGQIRMGLTLPLCDEVSLQEVV